MKRRDPDLLTVVNPVNPVNPVKAVKPVKPVRKRNLPSPAEPGQALFSPGAATAPPVGEDSPSPPKLPQFDLNDPALYLNRELTWLEFNRRVLHEAEDRRTPLLERIKFAAIVSANLDEFFMKIGRASCRERVCLYV